MRYLDARPKIRSGDLLAWSHRSWASWYDVKIQLVRAFTQSEYCHVGIAWRAAGRLFVLEAVQPRVRIFPLSKLAPFYWLPMGLKWTKTVEEWALECVGEPYSERQAVLAGLSRLVRGEDRVWQCAEYVDQVLKNAGVHLEAARAVPSDIVFAAQRLGAPLHLIESEGAAE